VARIAEPVALKLLKGRGNGKDTAGRSIPVPPKFGRGAPDMPADLSEDARAEWQRVVPSLDALDLLKPEDYAALVEHCETFANYLAAIQIVRAQGIVVHNPNTGQAHKNPALSAAEAAAAQLRASCREFGLTPSAEQRVGAAPTDEDSAFNPFGA
jgi:P27 family predicted phage terminase small subunit